MEESLDRCLTIIEKQTDIIHRLVNHIEGGNLSENSEQNVSQEPVNSQEPTNEMEDLFIKECEKRDRTKEDILNLGKKTGKEPIIGISKPTYGKYFTNADLDDISDKKKNFKKLSRADELDIIHSFEHIVGKKYYDARSIVEEEGYSLHPIYINDEPKNVAQLYSGTVLGVKIEDNNYNNAMNIISPQATITEIIDVGGQDEHDRGKISLK